MGIPPETDTLLRQAIAERRLIRFKYHGKWRISEPHDYGVQNGAVRLLCYQVGGQSNTGSLPAWRWIDVGGISELEILDKAFRGNRVAPSGQHHRWDRLFARVAPRD